MNCEIDEVERPAIDQKNINIRAMREGMRDGLPIALGYLAVAFTLGITARNAGLTWFQGFLASILINASAGEYAGFTLIESGGTYWEMALIALIINARYFLMSCALSQKLSPETPMRHRLLIGYDVTDEFFGISIARSGRLNPYYYYGAMMMGMPCWAVGTAVGIVAGNVLPLSVVSALSVALYGMFLAVIVPPARKNRVVAALVLVSFAASFVISKLTIFSNISSGTRTILLTVVIAAVAAILFPVAAEENEESGT